MNEHHRKSVRRLQLVARVAGRATAKSTSGLAIGEVYADGSFRSLTTPAPLYARRMLALTLSEGIKNHAYRRMAIEQVRAMRTGGEA